MCIGLEVHIGLSRKLDCACGGATERARAVLPRANAACVIRAGRSHAVLHAAPVLSSSLRFSATRERVMRSYYLCRRFTTRGFGSRRAVAESSFLQNRKIRQDLLANAGYHSGKLPEPGNPDRQLLTREAVSRR